MALTPKQQKFVEEYLIDLNATQAAIRAGYSVRSANEIGNENMSKPSIQAEISKAMAERSRRTGVNQDRIVQELARLAFVSVPGFVSGEGKIKDSATVDDLACVESIKYKASSGENGMMVEREVKVGSKVKALELLGKHVGMWNDKIDINVALPIVISGSDDLAD
jgi:phage terminase small subunit